jgi:hypothetical protein
LKGLMIASIFFISSKRLTISKKTVQPRRLVRQSIFVHTTALAADSMFSLVSTKPVDVVLRGGLISLTWSARLLAQLPRDLCSLSPPLASKSSSQNTGGSFS